MTMPDDLTARLRERGLRMTTSAPPGARRGTRLGHATPEQINDAVDGAT